MTDMKLCPTDKKEIVALIAEAKCKSIKAFVDYLKKNKENCTWHTASDFHSFVKPVFEPAKPAKDVVKKVVKKPLEAFWFCTTEDNSDEIQRVLNSAVSDLGADGHAYIKSAYLTDTKKSYSGYEASAGRTYWNYWGVDSGRTTYQDKTCGCTLIFHTEQEYRKHFGLDGSSSNVETKKIVKENLATKPKKAGLLTFVYSSPDVDEPQKTFTVRGVQGVKIENVDGKLSVLYTAKRFNEDRQAFVEENVSQIVTHDMIQVCYVTKECKQFLATFAEDKYYVRESFDSKESNVLK